MFKAKDKTVKVSKNQKLINQDVREVDRILDEPENTLKIDSESRTKK